MADGAREGREDRDLPIGPAGVPFPSEREWLAVPMPAEIAAEDFVARTLAALQYDGVVRDSGTDGEPLLREVIAAFVAPSPSPDFVARTLRALADDSVANQDRAANWRELLDRHTVPEPSPQFVSRTLDALREDRAAASSDVPPRSAGRWFWPILALAAAALLWLVLRGDDGAPLERLAQRNSPAFAHTYTPALLPAVLAVVAQENDPQALPDGAADGTWLLLGGSR